MGRYGSFNVSVPKRDKQEVTGKSHYNDEIDRTPGRPAGNTRDWGDATIEVQDAVRDALIDAAKARGLSKHDTAVVLAIVRNESGYNPDAANKKWSASSIGQFMDKTAPEYGVSEKDRFDVRSNAEGVVRHYIKSKRWAEKWHKKAKGVEKDRWIYKFYHDEYGKPLGFKEFDKRDGVGQWVAPIEKAIGPMFDDPDVAPGKAKAQQTPPRAAPAPTSPNKPHSHLNLPDIPGTGESPWNIAAFGRPPDDLRRLPSQTSPSLAAHGVVSKSATASSPFLPASYPTPVRNLLASAPRFLQPNEITGPQGYRVAPGPQASPRPKPAYSAKDQLDFLGRVYPSAKALSEQTGIALPFILGHAGHEVDWGKSIQGNNLFNLKADDTWRGPTHERGDTPYRSYPSYAESMKDYLAHLEGNPRYGKLFETITRGSVDRLADALQYSGYSDDPDYGARILQAAQSPLVKRAVWQYSHWPPVSNIQ